MQNITLNYLRFALAITDLLLINFCFLLCYSIFNKYGFVIDQSFYNENIIVSGFCWLVSTAVFGLYSIKSVARPYYMKAATWKSIIFYTILFLGALLLKNAEFEQSFLASFYIFLAFAFMLSRLTGDILRRLLDRSIKICDIAAAFRKHLQKRTCSFRA